MSHPDVLSTAPDKGAHRSITVTPVAGALGAEIGGIDLSAPIPDDRFAEIHRELLDHQVIFFRDQNLTPGPFLDLAKRWGSVHFYPYMKGIDSHPEVFEILTNPDSKTIFGNRWHTDQMYAPVPAKMTLLHALEVPEAGGDTLFANLYAAYDALSDGMKAMLARVRTFNNGDNKARYGGLSREAWYDANGMGGKLQGIGETQVIAEHPLIRTHPETGRKALFLGDQTERFADMTIAESRPLIDYLMAHARRPEFTCRFRWQPGSVAVWDNRCVLHYAIADYTGQRRRMHRITIAGDAPPF
jgi:taurine dioxygenase